MRIYERLRATWSKKAYRLDTINHCAPSRVGSPTCPDCFEQGRGRRVLMLLYAGTEFVCMDCKKSYPV